MPRSGPLVTCLLLTRSRRPWLPYALRCAQRQTYSPKEILVISDGEPIADLLPPGVRHLHLPGHPTIGRKRNVGCEAARGDLVAHFDDDDYSAPGRLVDQVQRLQAAGVSVTGYRTMRFTDGRSWWLYHGPTDYAIGTSLLYRRDWWRENRFPEEQIGEDNHLVSRARAQRQIVVADAGSLMFATIHNGNTSPRDLRRKQWQPLQCA